MDIKARRAITSINLIRVRHVTLVVGRVEVYAVPARREHELHTNPVFAVLVHVVMGRHEVTVARSLRFEVVVHAVETDGLLSEEQLSSIGILPLVQWWVGDWTREVAKGCVTGKHHEASWESLEVEAIEIIVCKHTPGLADDHCGAVVVDEVQRRCPKWST